ncbi:MAG: hypothetical protein HC792_06615, partial [Acaryochloridaceae cyanobacterium CSU_5_19]|nr:hypothetical protein [Acaryochloridaceae cyanobacterium CSU_5_19]
MKAIALNPIPFTAQSPTGFNQGVFSGDCYNLGQSSVLPHCLVTQQPLYGPHSPQQNSRVDDFLNRLVWGDNKLVMASLMRSFKGKVDL